MFTLRLIGARHDLYDRYWNLRSMSLFSGSGFKNHPTERIGHLGLRTYLYTHVVSRRERYQDLVALYLITHV